MDTESTEVVETSNEEVNIAEADARFNELQTELEKQKKLVEKLRSQEKHNQSIAKEVGAKNLEEALRALQTGLTKEANDWKDKYEKLSAEHSGLVENIKSEKLSSVLKDTLSKTGAKDVNTALKLIDKSQVAWNEDGTVDAKSVETLVAGLKQSDPILFEEVQIPDVKKSGEGTPVSSYEKDIMAARTQQQIEAVLKKYGKY